MEAESQMESSSIEGRFLESPVGENLVLPPYPCSGSANSLRDTCHEG